MDRIEKQYNIAKNKVEHELDECLKHVEVGASVIFLDGILEVDAALLSRSNRTVTVVSSDRLTKAYHTAIFPDSQVKFLLTNLSKLKLKNNSYDYVVYYKPSSKTLAENIAKKGIINAETSVANSVGKKPRKNSQSTTTSTKEQTSDSVDVREESEQGDSAQVPTDTTETSFKSD